MKIITTEDSKKIAQEMGLTGVLADEYVRAQGIERHRSRVCYVAACYSAQDADGKPIGLAALAALLELSEGGFGGGSPMCASSGNATRQLQCWSSMGTNRAHAHDAAAWHAARVTAVSGYEVDEWVVNAEGWLEAIVRTPKGTVVVDIGDHLQNSEYECIVRFAAKKASAAIKCGWKHDVKKWCRIADWATLELELDAVLERAEALDEAEGGGSAHWDEAYDATRGRVKALVASWSAVA